MSEAPSGPTRDESRADASARRGRRVAEGAFLLVAAWFGISSTWQITKSALFDPPQPQSHP